ncbi:MAG: hypothetical protein ACJASI_002730 [Glaciecola sp.]|jgi:hypothetical protein
MKINQGLTELTSDLDPDESKFLKLVTERDEFIQRYLQTLQGQLKDNFVSAELKVNGELVAHAEKSFKASLKQLTGLVRGRKVLKEYK